MHEDAEESECRGRKLLKKARVSQNAVYMKRFLAKGLCAVILRRTSRARDVGVCCGWIRVHAARRFYTWASRLLRWLLMAL